MVRMFSILLLLSAAAGVAVSQTGNGAIRGTVKDPSGASIPGASIKAVHADTSRAYDTTANEVGYFVLPSLQIGRYLITARAQGFQSWMAELVLQVSQNATADPVLQLAKASTEITVSASAAQLTTTTDPTLGTTIEQTRIEQLPLNGRMLPSLVAATVPGLEDGQVYGMRPQALVYLQDGAVAENADLGEVQRRPPGIDTIQEFKVETNNSSAWSDRPATVIVSTKSGTNRLHGALFETARNSAVGTARQRQDYWSKAPHMVRNEFGASLGGPVYLPGVYNGRNRTFFFFAYEGLQNVASNTRNISMPTMAMRQGDFSQLIDGTGRRTTLYDPWTTDSKTWRRLPFTNNVIPISRLSPFAKHLYSITPMPTHPDVNPMVASNYFAPRPNNRFDDTETVRIDQRLSDRDQLFLRYSHGNSYTRVNSTNDPPVVLDFSCNITNTPVRDDTATLSWTRSISPTFFSETVFSGSGEDYAVYGGSLDSPNDKLGLPNPFQGIGFPRTTDVGFGFEYDQYDNIRNSMTRIWGVDQNFTKIRGKHEFRFGGRLRRTVIHDLLDQQEANGQISFGSGATGLYDPTSGSQYSATPRTGHASANLFLGVAANYTYGLNLKWVHYSQHQYAGYLQDNIRVSPKLTLNLGVRYQYHPPVSEANNVLTGFDVKNKAVVHGASIDTMYKLGMTTPAVVKRFQEIGVKFETPQQAGLPDRLIYANRLEFAPRIGFAYRLASGPHSTVLRGGYGLYSFPEPVRAIHFRARRNAPLNAAFTSSVTSAAQSPDGLPNYGLRSTPGVIAGLNSQNVLDLNDTSAITPGSFMTSFVDPHQPNARAHEWNLTLEHGLMANTVARIALVGNHSDNLEQYNTFNEPPNNFVWFSNTGLPLPTGTLANVARRPFDQTTYGSVEVYQRTGWGNFNGVQLELERRYRKGLAFQLFYVMSNSYRVGGNKWQDSLLPDPSIYLKGTVPTDLDELNRFINYHRDTTIPKHRVRWNWVADLPFGRGKWLGGSVGKLVNALIGNWQVAGFGNVSSRYFALPTGNWGKVGDLEVYGTKYPIEDCRSGPCYAGYLYFNGYIPANRINSHGADGKPNGVMGVPADYKPSSLPIIPTPASGGGNDPLAPYYDTNTVWITLKNGTQQRVDYNNNLHPWRYQYRLGPMLWNLDASLFKAMRFNERLTARFNADFFNALNMPGMPMPADNGIITLRNSAQGARQLQLTLRLIW